MVASVKVMVMVMVKVMVMVMVMVLLPDGGHGLDAEEQSRGKVVHASDTLGMIINPEKKIKDGSCCQTRYLSNSSVPLGLAVPLGKVGNSLQVLKETFKNIITKRLLSQHLLYCRRRGCRSSFQRNSR